MGGMHVRLHTHRSDPSPERRVCAWTAPCPMTYPPCSPSFCNPIEPYRCMPVRLFPFPVAFPEELFRQSPFSVRFPARSAALLRFPCISIRPPPVFSRRTPTVIASPAWYTFGTPRIYRAAKIRTSKISTRNGQRVRLSLPEIPYANRPGRKKGPNRIPKTRDTGFPQKERETQTQNSKTPNAFPPSLR